MARPTFVWYWLLLLWYLACLNGVSSGVTNGVADSAGSVTETATPRSTRDESQLSADPNLAGSVAVVFVTSKDAKALSPCRQGLVRGLIESVKALPNHDVMILHGGNSSGVKAIQLQNGETVEVPLLSQPALKPHLPSRLRCDCASGNGGTPFLFANWLAGTNNKYDFAWYIEEDAVFTGNWRALLDLRMVSTNASRLRAASVFGKKGFDDDAGRSNRAIDASSDTSKHTIDESSDANEDWEPDANQSETPHVSPVDLVAHVTRVESLWKKRCVMPGNTSFPNGTGCVGNDGFVYKTWWPVIGLSRNFATRLMVRPWGFPKSDTHCLPPLVEYTAFRNIYWRTGNYYTRHKCTVCPYRLLGATRD
jgi:hypothetical protein|tara:strand:- start:944 stop:2038 length:1095 start_codon:yes stop_codon:yes gene_type:complete